MKIVREKLALLSMLTALTVVLSLFFVIPVPLTKGYVNFLEVGIYTVALLFGGPAGLIVGAISGGMLDLLLGYPHWLLFSVVIHGAQGYVAGRWSTNKSQKIQLLSLIVASIVMIIGYFLAGALLYGLGASLLSIPGNVVQTVFGTVGALGITQMIKRRSLLKQ